MKKLIFLTGMLLFFISVHAQSPAGKWKRIAGINETVSGKRTDLLKDFHKSKPCMAEVIYIFSADGKITENADSCPELMRSSSGESGIGKRWDVAGNNITIRRGDNETSPTIYTVEFNGMLMTWTLIYPDDPNIRDPEKVKSHTMVFEKL